MDILTAGETVGKQRTRSWRIFGLIKSGSQQTAVVAGKLDFADFHCTYPSPGDDSVTV